MVTCSSILAWKIPWTEEPGGPQSMGSQRVGHNWAHIFHCWEFLYFCFFFLSSCSQEVPLLTLDHIFSNVIYHYIHISLTAPRNAYWLLFFLTVIYVCIALISIIIVLCSQQCKKIMASETDLMIPFVVWFRMPLADKYSIKSGLSDRAYFCSVARSLEMDGSKAGTESQYVF